MRRFLVALVLLCTLAPAAPALAADPAKERVVISGPVTIDRDETSKDVVVVDGDVLVRGTVDGDVVAVDGDVTVRGRVTGNVVTVAGTATLGRRARVGGDLTYIQHKPHVTRGAKVAGETKKYDTDKLTGPLGVAAIAFWIAVGVSLLVLGLLLLLLAPRAADAVGRTLRSKWGLAIVVGPPLFVALPIIAGIAIVTVVGIPFGIGLLLALLPLYAIGYATAAFALGSRIVKKSRIPAFIVGLLILRLLALIPFAGGLIGLLATIFGLGLLFVTLFRARS
jgi:cytoskeletal protein CcmA (bactofilin family)